MKKQAVWLYYHGMENNYTQTSHGEDIDNIILDWYANMSEEEMEYWTLYAAYIVGEAKQRGARQFGLQSALLLIARYKLGLIPLDDVYTQYERIAS